MVLEPPTTTAAAAAAAMAFDEAKAAKQVDAIFGEIGQYQDQGRAKVLIMDVLSQTGGKLNPFRATYYGNDGTSTEMLVIRGIMTTTYKRQTFNTPIDLWIPHNFPHEGPLLFVVPFDDLKIPGKHKHVGSDGRVYHQYLSLIHI